MGEIVLAIKFGEGRESGATSVEDPPDLNLARHLAHAMRGALCCTIHNSNPINVRK
jgi:hypothetical protein